MAKSKTPKSPIAILTPTLLNIWVLGRIANGRREFPNKIPATSAPHLRRCMKAGLIAVSAVDVGRLRITDAGFTALVDAIATRAEKFPIPEGPFTTEICE